MQSIITGPLAWASGAGTAVAASATKTSLLTAAAATGKWVMPGNYFNSPGQGLYIRAMGQISTPAATMGNPLFTVDIGAVAVASTPAFVSLASQTNIIWQLDWWLRLRAVGDGTLANFMHYGMLRTALVSATNLVNLFPTTAPVVGTGFDASTAATAALSVTWSNATAGNSIQLLDYEILSTV